MQITKTTFDVDETRLYVGQQTAARATFRLEWTAAELEEDLEWSFTFKLGKRRWSWLYVRGYQTVKPSDGQPTVDGGSRLIVAVDYELRARDVKGLVARVPDGEWRGWREPDARRFNAQMTVRCEAVQRSTGKQKQEMTRSRHVRIREAEETISKLEVSALECDEWDARYERVGRCTEPLLHVDGKPDLGTHAFGARLVYEDIVGDPAELVLRVVETTIYVPRDPGDNCDECDYQLPEGNVLVHNVRILQDGRDPVIVPVQGIPTDTTGCGGPRQEAAGQTGIYEVVLTGGERLTLEGVRHVVLSEGAGRRVRFEARTDRGWAPVLWAADGSAGLPPSALAAFARLSHDESDQE